jgi:penicillin-binding protein 1A
MAADGRLTVDERDAALATDVELAEPPPLPEVVEPHLVDLVTRTLLDDPSFGATAADRADRLYRGGVTIHVTVDLQLQTLAREKLATHLPGPDDPEAAVTVVEPATGHVLAVTGNRAYEQLQFDLATQARRQPSRTAAIRATCWTAGRGRSTPATATGRCETTTARTRGA